MPSFSRDNWHYRHLMLPHLCEWAEIHIHHWPIPMHQMCFFASTLNHGTYAAYGFRHAFWSHSGNQIAISAAYKCFQTNVLRQHYCRKWTNSSFCVCGFYHKSSVLHRQHYELKWRKNCVLLIIVYLNKICYISDIIDHFTLNAILLVPLNSDQIASFHLFSVVICWTHLCKNNWPNHRND